MADEKPGDEMTLAAFQAQIADLRALVDQLRGRLDKLLAADADRAVLDRAMCIVTAIAGELQSNATRSDITGPLAELKQLVAPLLKRQVEKEESRAAA